MAGKYGSVTKIVRDPIHEYIWLYDDELPLIDSPPFQRLRNVKQNATVFLTYPAGSGSRFEHSLGVKHLATRMWWSAINKSSTQTVDGFLAQVQGELGWKDDKSDLLDRIARLVRFAALVHDLGHPPFSHTVEEVMDWASEEIFGPELDDLSKFKRAGGKLHEFVGMRLFEHLESPRKILGEDAEVVGQLLQTEHGEPNVLSTLHEIVAFDIDADRGDYLVRDGRTSGADFGSIDTERLVESLRLHHVQTSTDSVHYVIRASIKGISAIETFLVERYKAYRWLYFHPNVLATNAVLREVCVRLLKASVESAAPFAQLGFDLRPGSPLATRNDEMPAALFDDVYLLGKLRAAYDMCSELVDAADGQETRWGSASDAFRPAVRETKILLEELLFRKKSGVSLWKDSKSYQDFDKGVKDRIGSIHREDARERYRNEHGIELPENEMVDIYEATDFATNWLVKNHMAAFDDRQGLQDQVNDRLRDEGVFVLLSASQFKALEYGPAAGEYTVVGNDDRLYRVTDASELLSHLRKARRQDVLLHVYALWINEDPSRWDVGERTAKVSHVRERVGDVLVDWLKERLKKEVR